MPGRYACVRAKPPRLKAVTTRLQHARGLYLTGIGEGKPRAAVAAHVGARYTQHSTGVPDGADGFVAFVTDFVQRHPYREMHIVRGIEDGPRVALHVHQVLDAGAVQWVTIDFFETDDDGRIVEHWDVIAPFTELTPSGHTSVDGSTQVCDLDRTESNKDVVRGLIQDVLMPSGEAHRVHQYVSADQYVQHSAEVPDGLAPFAELVMAPDRPLAYQEIVLLIGQGNFVWTLCRASWKGVPYAQADIFRLENGKVVEHWDAAEVIGPEQTWANSGKF